MLEKMLARRNKTLADFHPNSTIAKCVRARGVVETDELLRIQNLPRRDWEAFKDLEFLIDELTDWLKKPEGQQRFWSQQAVALTELHDLGGLLGVFLVGGGKTLTTYAAPSVVEAERPVLLVPKSLLDKTLWEFDELEEHWLRCEKLKIVNYEKVSHVSGSDLLDELRPDLLICDEVHKLSDPTTTVARRVGYYMDENPDTIFCGLSGTVTKRSLMDFHHLLRWAFGSEQMPMPADPDEAAKWAQALDEGNVALRRSPGALRVFVPGEPERPSRQQARRGFSVRLAETPGVVVTVESDVDASIISSTWEPEIPKVIKEHLEKLKADWEMPDGQPCAQPVDVWRHGREYICGFYYKWKPAAPSEWLKARRAWFWSARNILADEIPGLDSPHEIALAYESGRLSATSHYLKWKQVRKQFKPNKVAVWLDTSVLRQVVYRMKTRWKNVPMLVWVEHTAAGEKLAEISGLPFFSREGKDEKGRIIESLRGKQSAILSIGANQEGRNLQAWNHNLIVTVPPNGKILEQVMGRSHREGQTADEVFFDFTLGDSVLRDGLRKAIRDAEYVHETMGTNQKLLLAGLKVTEPSLGK